MRRALLILSLALTCAIARSLGAQERSSPPPRDAATFKESDLPGYRLVLGNCLVCHSAEYVVTQPPTSPRTYWDATVKKMKKPFGAPFPDDDIAPMVDYLVKTYGAERPRPAAHH